MRSSIDLRLRLRLLRQRGDSGAMLIIALIIITTVALVTGAIMSHAWTNLRATVSLRSVAGTSYAADSAAKLAINNLRLGSNASEWTTPGFDGSWDDGSWNGWVYTNYSDGTGCFGASGLDARNQLAFTGVYPRSGNQTADPSARVECTPVPGTGILGSGGGVVIDDPDATDPFSSALTTLGSSSDHCGTSISSTCSGVFLKVLGTGANGSKNSAPIGGGVASKTTVTADNGGVATDGFVHAVVDCIGTIISPDKQCGPPTSVPTPNVPDSPLTAVPTVITTMPTPTNPGKNCSFAPGTYISGQDLSDALNKCTGVSHFASGKYYFDFLDNVPWTIKNTVIGGVLTGTGSIPGACQSPIKFPTTAGVQFVFGGSSRMEVANGANVELCGPANGGAAPMTIYQQQVNGSGVIVTPPPTTTPFTFGPEPAGAVTTLPSQNNVRDAFVPQSGPAPLTGAMLANVDSQGAKWTSAKKGNGGELNLGSFADSIPSGSTVSAATVHVDFSTAPNFTPLPAVSLSGVPLGSIGSSGDINLNAAQLAQLQAAIPGSGSLAPTIKFNINGSGSSPAAGTTVTIDKVTLTVSGTTTVVTPPVTVNLEKTTPTVFISTKANSTATFIVQGAIYAPTGTVDVDAGQTAFIAFRWGIVANGVSFKTYPQQLFGYPLVSIPKPGSGLGTRVTVVDLKVFVCVDGGACATGGAQALTVRVMITDPTYANHPVAGLRQIKVLSWAEQN